MKLKYFAIIVLLFSFFGLTLTSSVSESPVTDEPGHISTGLLYLKYGDLTFNSGSPLLANILSALPLYTMSSLTIPMDVQYFQNGYLHSFAKDFFMMNKARVDQILLLSRLPIMLAGMLLGLVIFIWTKNWYGFFPALLALGLYVGEPSFLAHAHYATTDVLFALMFTTTIFFLERYLSQKRNYYLFLFAALFALSQLVKITAIFLYPLCFLIFAMYSRKADVLEKIFEATRRVFVLAVFSLLAINSFYGFRDIGLPLSYYLARDQSIINSQYSMSLIESNLPFGQTKFAAVSKYIYYRLPLPVSYQYVKTLGWVFFRSKIPQPSFLAGRYSTTGWKLYFPVLAVLKMPLGLLLFVFASLFLALTKTKHIEKKEHAFLIIPVALSTAGLIFSRINTGYRLLLFLLPLSIIFAVRFVFKEKKFSSVMFVVMLVQLIVTVTNFPNFLGYVNLIPVRDKYKYMSDSNLDWGQDVKKLSLYLKDNKIDTIHMNLFGVMDTELYGQHYEEFGPSWIRDWIGKANGSEDCQDKGAGLYAVSANQLSGTFFQTHDCFNWLLNKGKLTNIIGSSIYIFRYD
ncbi:MAG: 4-amino-4-deoxy-L-arabinose transferase [uncultured bacterium]|uniref:Glycosyltransferase RgtA/B/C/D-like domain-containing protein n=1 Tax=Candidatus Gottesmanbacteria bacterium RIFCSPLOWO2_01_FULL_43_11b TaxID=1798392 RepID=A0A1F6AIJ1_9BACT|nr:MAG: 4-amino-4-deoxy-L-arabinose transferase [uncultured bacterium]OGG24515.1 MAG: hypothetical protein A3A79_05010 [Candidatus Gottesmanbacteria bacterium RIFCSPLOWO2_01_FULL_43_11b]